MKLLSLFSGIGAFEKALERKGIDFELVNYCEFDKYASKSYSLIHNVSETMNLGDITKVNISELKPYSADLITYGFPCQDISNAGKQRGFEHDGQLTRSGLFFYASKIIGRVKPKVAICENVKALTGKKFTKEFETVLQTLEDMGYKNYWQVLNAKDYGIPQNRERVFIVSIRNDIDKKYEFPTSIKLELRLKDMLEKEVDEKYYLSDKMLEKLTWGIKGRDIIEVGNLNKGGQKGGVLSTDGICSCLSATDYKQPKQIVDTNNVLQIGNIVHTGNFNNPQRGRIYSSEGISPTLNTCGGGGLEPKIVVKEATKKGYAEAYDGDSINFEQPNSKTRRGRVGHGVAQTLTTSPQQAVVEPFIVASRGRNPENPSDRTAGAITEQRLEPKFDGTTNTLTTVQKDNYVAEPCVVVCEQRTDEGFRFFKNSVCGTLRTIDACGDKRVIEKGSQSLRIRKLTPKECFRLMGFDDADVEILIENGISNTQLYKQAGNSIVVNVLEAIFENLKDILCD